MSHKQNPKTKDQCTEFTLLCVYFNPAGGQVTSPSDVLHELQKTILSPQGVAHHREKPLAKLSAMLEDAENKQVSQQLDKDEVQKMNTDLLENYKGLQASVIELQTRVQEQEEKALQKDQLDKEIRLLRKSLASMSLFLTY